MYKILSAYRVITPQSSLNPPEEDFLCFFKFQTVKCPEKKPDEKKESADCKVEMNRKYKFNKTL